MKLNKIDIGNVPSKQWWDDLVRKINSQDIIVTPPLSLSTGEEGSTLSVKLPPSTYIGKIESVSGSGGTINTKKYNWTEMAFDDTSLSGTGNLTLSSGYAHSGYDLIEVNNRNLRSGLLTLVYKADGKFICEYPFNEFYGQVSGWASSGTYTSGDSSGVYRSGPISFYSLTKLGSGTLTGGTFPNITGYSGWTTTNGFSGVAYEQNAIYRNMSGGSIIKITETLNDSGYPIYIFENPYGYSVKYVDSGISGSGDMLYWDQNASRKSDEGGDCTFDALGQFVSLPLGQSGYFLKSDGAKPTWVIHSGDQSGGTYVYSTSGNTSYSCSISNLRFDGAGHVVQYSSPNSGFVETWYYLDGTPV